MRSGNIFGFLFLFTEGRKYCQLSHILDLYYCLILIPSPQPSYTYNLFHRHFKVVPLSQHRKGPRLFEWDPSENLSDPDSGEIGVLIYWKWKYIITVYEIRICLPLTCSHLFIVLYVEPNRVVFWFIIGSRCKLNFLRTFYRK